MSAPAVPARPARGRAAATPPTSSSPRGWRPVRCSTAVELEGCRFERAVLEGAVLRGCTFTRVRVLGCNLNRVDLAGSRFVDCTFVDCTALAVTWTRAAEAALSARPWDFERCRLDLASFQEAAMAGSRLVDCSLREADFGGADAQRVDFGGSGWPARCSWGPTCAEASLLGATGYAFDPSENRVRGLRVDAVGRRRGCSWRWASSSSSGPRARRQGPVLHDPGHGEPGRSYSHPTPSPSGSTRASSRDHPRWIGSAPAARTASQSSYCTSGGATVAVATGADGTSPGVVRPVAAPSKTTASLAPSTTTVPTIPRREGRGGARTGSQPPLSPRRASARRHE